MPSAPSSSHRRASPRTARRWRRSASASTARRRHTPPPSWHGISRPPPARGCRVVRILEPLPPGGPTLGYDADWAQHAEERRDAAQAELDAELAELGDLATGEVVVGDPATELAYAGNDFDLLVTGSRGYGPVRRLMLGSTSTRLVREAPCPVLVLTRGAEVDAENGLAASASAAAT